MEKLVCNSWRLKASSLDRLRGVETDKPAYIAVSSMWKGTRPQVWPVGGGIGILNEEEMGVWKGGSIRLGKIGETCGAD
ncbi:MAG: hypothetical protein ACE5I9_08380 [Candidatus Methylomirabilales bacterium]